MQEEIGKTAGAIWDALNTSGEQSLSELKKGVKGEGFESHLFEGRHPLAAAGMSLVGVWGSNLGPHSPRTRISEQFTISAASDICYSASGSGQRKSAET